jgi:hypothetical protein
VAVTTANAADTVARVPNRKTPTLATRRAKRTERAVMIHNSAT